MAQTAGHIRAIGDTIQEILEKTGCIKVRRGR
jgi:hypothetical protein